MAKKVAPPAAAISQQNKEHLKSLFADFLSHKEYRELKHGCMIGEMMITLCAAYGKFDFSVVLEHFFRFDVCAEVPRHTERVHDMG